MDAHEAVPAAPLTAEPGHARALGATPDAHGTNFAIWSRHAERMTLVLFAPGGAPRGEVVLDITPHRTGDVWHVWLPGVRAGAEYGWRAEGPAHGRTHAFDPRALLLDPYAKGVAGSEQWAERRLHGRQRRGVVCDLTRYDWHDDRPPGTALARSVIYEVHVRAFTRHDSAGVRAPGTFAGLAEKAPWLAALGVTAVQLMPVAEFEEADNPRTNPLTGEALLNVWGYAPLAFMAPRTAYAATAHAAGALDEFRDMVRTLHAHGIEVLLDVVYNHVGDSGGGHAPMSWRGLDRTSYFLLDSLGRDLDYTGCGHTFACARPPAADLILDALRFWARDMHVDGFRFDLASTLTRGERGEPLADPPLIRRMCEDPVLAHCKLLAEPWDTGIYHVGRFPHHGRFAELNGRFRDDLRDWLRGKAGGPGAIATRLSGSSDLYAPERGPGHSVNFITSHDGFTLADLVSHRRKHNDANGEQNRDGTDDHRSWNGGAEGPTHDPVVRAVRSRQAHNAAALLLLSRGSVLWLWGDESLRSQRGNNNAWCQDGPSWWLDWDAPAHEQQFRRFVTGLLALRRDYRAFNSEQWFATSGPGSVEWHGATLAPPDWDHGGLRLAMHLRGDDEPDFLLLSNSDVTPATFVLPEPSGQRRWHLLVDTAAPAPHDWTPLAEAHALEHTLERTLMAHSLVLLAAV